jgi:hypothetical protein
MLDTTIIFSFLEPAQHICVTLTVFNRPQKRAKTNVQNHHCHLTAALSRIIRARRNPEGCSAHCVAEADTARMARKAMANHSPRYGPAVVSLAVAWAVDYTKHTVPIEIAVGCVVDEHSHPGNRSGRPSPISCPQAISLIFPGLWSLFPWLVIQWRVCVSRSSPRLPSIPRGYQYFPSRPRATMRAQCHSNFEAIPLAFFLPPPQKVIADQLRSISIQNPSDGLLLFSRRVRLS